MTRAGFVYVVRNNIVEIHDFFFFMRVAQKDFSIGNLARYFSYFPTGVEIKNRQYCTRSRRCPLIFS